MKKSHFLCFGRDPMQFLAKLSGPKIQPEWMLKFVTFVEIMSSVVFTWGPFEVAPGARPITILNPSGFVFMDKVKTKTEFLKLHSNPEI